MILGIVVEQSYNHDLGFYFAQRHGQGIVAPIAELGTQVHKTALTNKVFLTDTLGKFVHPIIDPPLGYFLHLAGT